MQGKITSLICFLIRIDMSSVNAPYHVLSFSEIILLFKSDTERVSKIHVNLPKKIRREFQYQFRKIDYFVINEVKNFKIPKDWVKVL